MPDPLLTADQVRKVARLACLALSDDQVEQYRAELSAVLASMQRLRELDLTGVEPMTHPAHSSIASTQPNRLAEDVPGETLATKVLLDMAPATYESFIKVPKVLGSGGGA